MTTPMPSTPAELREAIVGRLDERLAETDPRKVFYEVYDMRDGKRCSMATYPQAWMAERAIQSWRDRDARGGRPDIHDLIPHIGIRAAQFAPGGIVHGPREHPALPSQSDETPTPKPITPEGIQNG